jgi:2-dehydro-3-deoxygluconokinase/2-dehydro-3-deoxygalactonokinase
MIQLNAMTTGPLRHVVYFERHMAGAEANVAVAVVRMGLKAGFITSVGDDEFGKCVAMTLRGEGVDLSKVRVEKGGVTGVYFVQRGYPVPERSKVVYYRKGSSASKLGPKDIDHSYIASSRLLYLTGITPALSESCLAACVEALSVAKENGLKVAFDTNIRPTLWVNKNLRRALLPLLNQADIVLTDPSDAQLLTGERNAVGAAKELMSRGTSVVVMKGGTKETFAFSGREVYRQRSFQVPVIDPIGAGDAFGGAFVSGYLKGWKIHDCLAAGSAAGSLVVTTRGDEENIPTEQDITEFLRAQGRDGN